MKKERGQEGEKEPATQLLKALEDMLHKRIARKKLEIHKYRERAETDRVWTEID